MGTFRVTSPDGAEYEVTAPDGASQAQIMSFVRAQHGDSGDVGSLPGAGADAELDPRLPKPKGESPITHRAAMLPFLERADGSMEFAWPQMALDAADSIRQLGRAGESATGVPHSQAETFPR